MHRAKLCSNSEHKGVRERRYRRLEEHTEALGPGPEALVHRTERLTRVEEGVSMFQLLQSGRLPTPPSCHSLKRAAADGSRSHGHVDPPAGDVPMPDGKCVPLKSFIS